MNTAERRATAALWSIQGIGPITFREIRKRAGPLAELLDRPLSAWAPLIEWQADSYALLMAAGSLEAAAERVERSCKDHHARILFPDDPGFPSKLGTIPDAPELVFAFGPAAEAPPRRRLAIVGTRNIDNASLERVRDIAAEAAHFGLGIISGAARGTDQAAHRGALLIPGETWAFLGSALDEIDFSQRVITRQILENGGSVFSEYPPGYRSNKHSFTRRNRLISGSSDAVLVFRAPVKSGALYTAGFALEQGRPLLATPGDPWSDVAKGSNELIKKREALPAFDLEDLVEAVGLKGSLSENQAAKPIVFDPSELSPLAGQVLKQLASGSADFEGLLHAMPGPTSGQLSAALVELEVFGAVVHKGGRRYEKR